MNFKSNKRKCTFFTLRKYFSLVLVLCVWAISPQLNAQTNSAGNTKVVKGIVLDELNEPMIGVNVMEKGTTNGTITDFNGKFQLKVASSTSKLTVTYIGYGKKEFDASASDVKIKLEPDTKVIDELVVVGYASQSKKSVVGSIAQASGESLKQKGVMGSLTDALSGSMPGVTVMTNSGAPGGGGVHGEESTILIRGMNTWNNAAPLILVDGMERSMNDVSIDEIENFSVLKDASATAVFGVKGANGVILITTKRGQTGKAKITAEANISMKSVSRVENTVNSYQGLLARNYGIIQEIPFNDNGDINSFYISPRELGYYRDGIEPEKYPNTNWTDVMMRDQAVSSKYNINVSGGTDFVKYFTTLSYLHEGDLLKSGTGIAGYNSGFSYDRVNFRTNLDFNLTKTTTFKVNLSGYYGNQEVPGDGAANITTVRLWWQVYKANPNSPLPIYSDGMYGSDDPTTYPLGSNSYFLMLNGGTNVNKRTALTSDFDLEEKMDYITKGLSLKGRFSFDNYFSSEGRNILDNSGNYTRKYYDRKLNDWVYSTTLDGKDGFDFVNPPLGYTNETIDAGKTQRNLYYELALNYKRSFGKHNVGALGLFSRQETAKGSNWPGKREDWVYRATYDYDGKYLFETNGAYNGSEKFGPEYKFDFFPSFALGWRASEEKFIKNSIPQISNLKFRYSIGWVGNDNLGDEIQWAFLTTWDKFSESENLGGLKKPAFGSGIGVGSIYSGNSYQEGRPGNPNLRWEKVKKQNFGVEIGLFNDLITGTVDYFMDNRFDMLIKEPNIPAYYGADAPAANLGEVKSHGFELDFKIQKKFGKTNVWASYNWTEAISKIIKKDDPLFKPFYQKEAGYTIGQVTANYMDDFIGSWDDLYTGVMGEAVLSRNLSLPGDLRAADYNGDGIINSNDEVPFGYAQNPRNTYGFSLGADYAGFSASAQFYGMYNVNVNMQTIASFQYNAPVTYNYIMDKVYTPEYGVESPSRPAYRFKNGGAVGHFNEVDGSLFRLKNVQLAYSIPKKIVSSLGVESIKISVTGNNLFLWSKLPFDVEGTGLSDRRYPTTKNVSFGLNVSL